MRTKCVTCGLETTKKYTDLNSNKFTACSGLCADIYLINSNFSIESEVKTSA